METPKESTTCVSGDLLLLHRNTPPALIWMERLTKQFHAVHFAERLNGLLFLRECPVDVLIIEHFSVFQSTLDWVQRFKSEFPTLELFLLAETWQDEERLAALKWGVAGCLTDSSSEPYESGAVQLSFYQINKAIQRKKIVELAASEQQEAQLYMPFQQAKRTALTRFEIFYANGLCERADGNISQAARLAGMDRANFRRLLKKHSA